MENITLVSLKNNETISLDKHEWEWMIDSIGLPLGCSRGIKANSHVVLLRDGKNPYLANGYEVKPYEAGALALNAKGLLTVEESIKKQWDSDNGTRNAEVYALVGVGRFRQPAAENNINILKNFYNWVMTNGLNGFTIGKPTNSES